MIKILFQRKFDTAIALMMPTLLMIMTLTHSMVFLYTIFVFCLLQITKPLVIFPVYFVASLSTAYFAVETGVSAGRFLSLIMIISLFINLTIKGVNKQGGGYHLVWILFVIYCFLSAGLSVTGSLVPFVLLIQGLLVLLLLPKIKGINVEYFCSLLFFTCFITLIGVWLQFLSVGFEQLLYERYKGAEGEINSNRIAMMVMQIGLVLVSPFVVNEQNKIVRWVSVIGFIMAIVIIVLTGSRASLLATLGAFGLVFIKLSYQNVRKYLMPIIVVACLTLIFIQQFGQTDLQVLDRFSLESLENSGGSDRMPAIEIMMTYIFPKYPLFGVGLGGENFNAIAVNYGMNHPCHSIFFDPLSQLGIVGFVIFFFFCFNIFKRTWRSLNSTIYQFPFIISLLLVLGAVINGMGETIYLEKWFWNTLSLCLLFVVNKRVKLNGQV